jgi:peroxin-2
VERLIGARLVYRQPSMSRLVSFEYLNRQLVWQELSEFMLFLLPLINVSKVSLLLGVWNMRWSFTPERLGYVTGPSGHRHEPVAR